MKYTPIILTAAVLLLACAGVLVSGRALAGSDGTAAADKAAAAADNAARAADKEAAAADADSARSDANMKQLEAQLEAARAKLEQSAHEVAELSARLSKPLVEHFMTLGADGFSRAVIGVQLDPASGPDGARIEDVSPGGPAAEAGLRGGDVIVSVNGAEVKGTGTARQVLRLMHDVTPESKVKVRVLRDGKSREFVVTTRSGMGFPGFPEPPPVPALPNGDFPFSGPAMFRRPLAEMELATLTPQLGRYFGTDKGVLVIRAPREGGFKLEDGDVILAIDGREPTSGSHAARILGSYQPGEKVAIRLMREHKIVNVETTLPEREGPQRRVRMIHSDEAPA